MRIGIAAKLSKIEWDMHRLDKTWDEVIRLYRFQKEDVDKILNSHHRQKENIEHIQECFPDAKLVNVIGIENGIEEKSSLDVLISVGGDNFFQICTHLFKDCYFVSVNSDSLRSHGALLNFDSKSLESYASKIIDGSFNYKCWTRVSTFLNDKYLGDSSCTVSLSIKATDMISRYLLNYKDFSEEQKSSGLLVVSGAASSTGSWYRNAGLYLPQLKSGFYQSPTRNFSKSAQEIRTLTREPFKGADCNYKLLNLSVKKGEELSLIYWANNPSELSFDSVKRFEVNEGDRLSFRVSEKPLKVIIPF